MSTLNRRELLTAAAAAPLALMGAARQNPGAAQAARALPAPRYTLSANIELMFPREVAHAERIERIAAAGLKAFSFWGAGGKDLDAMRRAQQRTGLACGSITGNGNTGWKTGLTATGHEDAFLKDFLAHVEVAKRFDVKNLICFTGETQPNIPLEVQHRQIIEGLKKTGDLAAKHGVYFCLEPLNSVESPRMSVLSAAHGFRIVEEVNHPHVRLDFDMYHLQLSEGNLINNLRRGLRDKLIRFVEIGDVPGRKEPGTGETNYANIFKVLREEGFADFVGMEHGTSSTPEHAMKVVRTVAGV
jgi:hydroxypyruvate isomerase